MRGRYVVISALLIIVLAFVLSIYPTVSAQGPATSFEEAAERPVFENYIDVSEAGGDKQRPSDDRLSVIVKLEDAPLATYTGDIAGLAATSPAITGVDELDVQSTRNQMYLQYLEQQYNTFERAALNAIPDATVTGRFKIAFGGVSMVVPADAVETLAGLPGVEAVYPDELEQPTTEVSPAFIGADQMWADLGGQESAGEGVIVGVLDTGIWPEHASYSDPDPAGKAYAPPPVAPGSNGFGSGGPRNTCDFGNTAYNPDDAPFTCNNKLIGAYDFLDTYEAVVGLLPEEFDSARDDNGHGTHTSSTAAGNGGVTATLFGVSRGTLSGIAPRAHVVAYKVCGDQGCFQSDSIAAVEQAILDSVDVINFSISGGGSPYTDPVSQAFLDAYSAGVLVSASAGNSGPGADSVDHREPWTITVGASTTDRHFLSTITLTGTISGTSGVTETLTLEGASVTDGIETPTEVVLASDFGDGLCLTPFAPGTWSGEIVVCERGAIARVEKSFNVAEGGAGGLILYNPTLQGLATDNHFIPSVHIENDAGTELLDFMDTHTDVVATFTDGTAKTVQGDVMAAFSSRGGPEQELGISKPDVTAPGVQILAGHTPMPATVVGGKPGELFQAIQGTSMSSPHVAGAAALLKALHPSWSPAQIKSALMTTGKTDGVTKEDGTTPADPFDLGSGRIDLTRAGDPGLTFEESGLDYVSHRYDLWNANYPSLYVPVMAGKLTVNRTVRSHVATDTEWSVSVDAPVDLDVTVPVSLSVPANGEATFSIAIDASDVPLGEVRHAHLHLAHGPHTVHFPITIVRDQPGVTLEKTATSTTLQAGDTTTFTISATNTTFDDAFVAIKDTLPDQLEVVSGTVSGATATPDGVVFNGSLFGAAPPIISASIISGTSPAGYLPLAGFGGTIEVSASDESIANFTVPAFEYAGETYTSLGIVSNGYLVVGGGTGADVDFVNTDLPDPAPPNNVLAPFWTDLNPAAGGRILINVLTDSVNSWIVVEWESVPNWSDSSETNTFQVWIGIDGAEDITYVYGPDITDGDGGFLTVGAENKFGNSGDTVYFDGEGTPPAPSVTGYEVRIESSPGAPGETHVITFVATADRPGRWTNCAEMSSDSFAGINVACVQGIFGTEIFFPVAGR